MANFIIEVDEENDARYDGILRAKAIPPAELGDPLPLANIDSATLTLSDAETGELVGPRPANQDVLNANGVTIGVSDGSLTWLIDPEDNVILDDTIDVGDRECHYATFRITYDTDRQINHVIEVNVKQLQKVP